MSTARYHRQMLLPDWGEEGQFRLSAAKILLVGCGALGCSIADLLVRAGVGHLTIVDRDIVELTNLQRQTLYDEKDVAEGLPKAEAARRRLAKVNSQVKLTAVIADYTSRNAESLASNATLLLDGTDNFETRYLLNDLAVKRHVPYVYGGAVGTRGMAMTIRPGHTPCLRCVFEEPPPAGVAQTCDTAGVLGPMISLVAAHQATEALKLLLGRQDLVLPALLDIDAWTNTTRRIDLSKSKRTDCPCCGLRRFEFLDGDRAGQAAALCGQNAVQVAPSSSSGIDLAALSSRLSPHGNFTLLPSLLIRGTLTAERGDNGAPISLTVFADGRAIVKGTSKPEVARTLYARYIGV
jgi:adenylyltransferase/sulfurtransferase